MYFFDFSKKGGKISNSMGVKIGEKKGKIEKMMNKIFLNQEVAFDIQFL